MIRWFGWAVALAALCAPRLALAITIGFAPASQTVGLGGSADVALTISGLGDGTAPSLGVFDLVVGFDPGVVSFSAVSFGDPGLGDQLDPFGLGSLTVVDPGVPGAVRLFELSLDLPSDLDTLQAGAFTLATLSFAAVGVGTSPLSLSVAALGDAYGRPLSASLARGSIAVVPEPGAALVFLAGLLVVGRAARRSAAAPGSEPRFPGDGRRARDGGTGRPGGPDASRVTPA